MSNKDVNEICQLKMSTNSRYALICRRRVHFGTIPQSVGGFHERFN